jgi:hypothetical protein
MVTWWRSMAERRRRAPRRNPYRPGTASYALTREATLTRRAALAQATATRAKAPEARRRAKRRASDARRELRAIETREEYRSKLNERDRRVFDRLTLAQQQRLIRVVREYPGSVPKDLPDPFIGPKRETQWRLSYATRAGIRQRPTV